MYVWRNGLVIAGRIFEDERMIDVGEEMGLEMDGNEGEWDSGDRWCKGIVEMPMPGMQCAVM